MIREKKQKPHFEMFVIHNENNINLPQTPCLYQLVNKGPQILVALFQICVLTAYSLTWCCRD